MAKGKAEAVVTAIKAAYLQRVAERWEGHERELLVEMVRGLDEAAFAFTLATNRAELRRYDEFRQLMVDGAASAMAPLLHRLRDAPGGVPWAPSRPELAMLADTHLAACGRIAAVLRVVQLERFGLAEATFLADDRLVVEVASEAEERAERAAGARLIQEAAAVYRGAERRLAAQKDAIARQIDRCVYPAQGWFIGYDNTDELIAYHRQAARIYGAGVPEAAALPPEARLGDRSFAGWTDVSLYAYGATLQHCAFASRLKATKPWLRLRNLLTIYARKEDIAEVWQARGETATSAAGVISALNLDAGTAERYDRDHDHPLPYYIDIGRDFVLLPMFGGLLNPYGGALSQLRSGYRTDWDNAVNGREAVYREDLRRLLPASRYFVLPTGRGLKRDDGSDLTDVDAVVLDRATGDVVLVQLKWPDIYGRSLVERNSRRSNLLRANDWVEKVYQWVGGRSAADVAQRLGLGPAGRRPPVLLVMSRHAARFAGENGFDPRARWISWPSFVTAYRAAPKAGVVSALRRRKPAPARPTVSHHELPGLTVEVRAS